MILYWDTSALAKGLVAERWSPEVRAVLEQQRDDTSFFSSHLLRLEMHRVGIRVGRDRQAVENLVSRVNLLTLDAGILDAAGLIPYPLGALDAIHVTTCNRLVRNVLEEEAQMIAFDRGVLDAAIREGIVLHELAQQEWLRLRESG